MISIIVCTVNPERLSTLEENIKRTVGIGKQYEIIAIDNTESPRSLAAVYNDGASCAKYPNLLFIHEDAGFITEGWLDPIERKLEEPDCGVIGFAGARAMFNIPGGWGSDNRQNVINIRECGHDVKVIPEDTSGFEEVVVLDGLALFVRKDVWAQYPFDEERLKGFHCYDIDFTLVIAKHYRNFVCTCVDAYHNSRGNFDREWLNATMELYETKWKGLLPCFISGVKLSPTQISRLEERACFRFIKRLHDLGIDSSELTKRFLKYPLRPRHAEHLVKMLIMKMK